MSSVDLFSLPCLPLKDPGHGNGSANVESKQQDLRRRLWVEGFGIRRCPSVGPQLNVAKSPLASLYRPTFPSLTASRPTYFFSIAGKMPEKNMEAKKS